MPLYEYVCEKCDKQFEKLVSISNAAKPQTCPNCGSDETKKMMSAFSMKNPTSSSPAPKGGGGFS